MKLSPGSLSRICRTRQRASESVRRATAEWNQLALGLLNTWGVFIRRRRIIIVFIIVCWAALFTKTATGRTTLYQSSNASYVARTMVE